MHPIRGQNNGVGVFDFQHKRNTSIAQNDESHAWQSGEGKYCGFPKVDAKFNLQVKF